MSAEQKERKIIVKLHKKGYTVREIGDTLDIPFSKAQYWITRFRNQGESGLKTKKGRGRPSLLNNQQIKELKRIIKEDGPIRFGGQAVSWLSKEIKILIKDRFGVVYTLRHVQRILHKLGFSRITPRSKHILTTKAGQEAYKEEFKKNSTRNMWVGQLQHVMKQHSN